VKKRNGTGNVEAMLDYIVHFVERFGHWGYLVIFLVVMVECQALLGLFMPGESLVLVSGFLAAQGVFDLDVLIFVIFAAAVVGDSIGYELGRQLGRSWLEEHGSRFGLRRERLDHIEMFFAGHGGKSVFASHFMHLGRAVTPFLAGSSRMPYLRFFVFNALGCALWAATFALLGYFFGESWHVVGKWFGRASAILVGLLLLFLGFIWLWRWRGTKR
jgi:membrane protein DedA with SNARE-associated domain